ncbi:hypothetical protein GCM10023191_001310 [Actinoallomurus oryzae]|uniref:CcmD family protein n=1 Tax=Actinoallomurus oryzae TaxID=502180 RepID=A0ABP8P7R4_9ACTN
MTTVGRHRVPAATHHHTGLFHADHLTAVVAVGAVLWILGTAFVTSWQDSGNRLRGILSELDEHHDPHAEQHTDAHTASPH